MKTLLRIIIMLLLAVNAQAQWFNINNLTGTTQAYGTYNVTVSSSGLVGMGGSPACVGATQYWEDNGSGVGQYTFTLSKPVWGVRVNCFGLNSGPLGGGEYLQMFINGAPYTLTAADILSFVSCMPGGGPSYLWTGFFMGPVGSGYNGGTIEINSCVPITSFEVLGSGMLNGVSDSIDVDTVRSMFCIKATSNAPCVGDSLKLDMVGDSTGATYLWKGPGGFTSTLQDPFIFPSTMADSGTYVVIRTVSGVSDTDSTDGAVHAYPVVTVINNSPLCVGLIDTLKLIEGPPLAGAIYNWSGPNGFIDTVENPIRPNFMNVDTGFYFVSVTSVYGCTSKDSTYVKSELPPARVSISGKTPYCQGIPFVPFTVIGKTAGSTLEWYTAGTGGVASVIPDVVNTSVVGFTTSWVSQRIGSCESPRDSFITQVIHTPGPPIVTGTVYCQFIGPYDTLVPTIATGDTALWYTMPTGIIPPGTFRQPLVNINVAGVTTLYISQRDSGCEGPRTPVTVTVNPKPAPPVVTPDHYCQYASAIPLRVTASTAGDFLTYFGLGISGTGTSSDPTPPTIVVGNDVYGIIEQSKFGCWSDTVADVVPIIAKPSTPVTRDTTYCQGTLAPPLTADSSINSRLNWYLLGTKLNSAPVPSNTTPGDSTWYVSQSILGCQSDSTTITVTTLYKPVFSIAVTNPVCQFDSLTLSYLGPTLVDPSYLWTLPVGAYYGHLPDKPKSLSIDSIIKVQFDSVTQNNYVHLHVSDYGGFCFGDTSVRITVVAQPVASAYSKADVCLGDTIGLALSGKSADASDFVWQVDNEPLDNTSVLNLIASSSNSGGPFSISWNDSGRHVIQLNTSTLEGCHSQPSYDTVDVHTLPDASFRMTLSPGSLCIEDSVLFSANDSTYNNSFQWSPAHAFNNVNKPSEWGRVEQSKSVITLTVTDPFGCKSSQDQELDPGSCCTVLFPNAFTPNGDTHDDVFRPIFQGFHNFHIFRIANRWGQTIFESTNNKVEWDGNYNGVPQDLGVYYYYIKFDCGGQTIEQTGDVTLIR